MKFTLTGTRLILASFLLFLVTNVLIWTAIWDRISVYNQNIIALVQLRAENNLEEAESRLLNLYNISKKNVLFIRDMVELDIANNLDAEVTAKRIVKFLELDANYFQARLIDASGKEVIKAENTGNSIFLSKPATLQYKGDRSYFNKAFSLKKDRVFISDMDLNKENGVIEIPNRPTMRFFSPVFNGYEKTGIVGLNLNLKSWFRIFENENIGILNTNNEVYFDSGPGLYKKFDKDLVKQDLHGHANYFSKKISLEGNNYWTLYTRPDNAAMHAKLKDFRNDVYKTGAVLSVGVFFLLLIVYKLHQKNRNISKLSEALEVRLNERDTLIKEIHHRVKNNLQVVASLLSLQSSFIKDEAIKVLFRYSQYRINSMGLVHEMLYKSNDLNRIDYGEYIKELVNALILSMKGKDSNIELVAAVENIYLNIDTSIPLGLMINEIVTNSLKYGFADRPDGTITIKMEKMDYPTYKLTIGDNGSGFSPKISFRNTKSLGLKLIHKLALQLRGNVEKDNSKKGTYYLITFQEIEQTS